MKISMLKSFAWKNFESGNDEFGFMFKGKKVTYPWLDFEKQSFELNTVQAIDEYGLDNMKYFCEQIINLAPCKTQTFSEWLGGDAEGATIGQMEAYRRWCEDDVEYEHGKLKGLGA